MNILFDKKTGDPRWDAARLQGGPKEDFVLEAARLFLAGELTVDGLKQQIISAANHA